MPSQGGPGSGGKAGDIVLPGHKPVMTGGGEGLFCLLQEEGQKGERGGKRERGGERGRREREREREREGGERGRREREREREREMGK